VREALQGVDAEAVDAAVQPEAQDVVHRRLDLGVVPVEVRLLGQERVQVPLARRLVQGPRGARRLELRHPVVGRPAVRRAVAPDVPVALGIVAARARRGEPRVPVRGVVGHPVEDHPDPAGVAAFDEAVEVGQRAERRIDVAVVRDVVAEVRHGGGVDRRQPHRRHAEVVQVVDALRDPREVADAVAVGVRERPRVDLVDGAALPPWRLVTVLEDVDRQE
jgi:hypothetical protein